ncbi:LLM class flavin-dependent oxidoreductase [Nonomuraea thailandensis]
MPAPARPRLPPAPRAGPHPHPHLPGRRRAAADQARRRIGDGWLSHELCSPAYLRERVLPNLTAGLDGRDREELDVVVSACCSIDPDPATARRRAAGTLAFYAGVATYRDFFAFHDLAAEHAAAVTAFRAGERPDVPDRMIDPLVLAGTPDQVAERLAGYAGLADTVKLTPAVHGNPPEQVRRNQARIIELIGTL